MSNYIPNSFQTPNAIVDELMPLLTDSEFRVLMFMVRQILGWQSSLATKRANISQSVLESGYTYHDSDGNEHVKQGCGIGKPAIQKALKALVKYRIVKKIGKPTNDGQEWELCLLTDGKPDIAGLQQRNDEKNRKAKKQTAIARSVNPIFTNRGVVQQVPQQGGSSTSSQGGSSTTHNETHNQTHEETQLGAVVSDGSQEWVIQKLALLPGITGNDVGWAKAVYDKYPASEWVEVVKIALERSTKVSIGSIQKYVGGILDKRAVQVELDKQAELDNAPVIVERSEQDALRKQELINLRKGLG